jgi:hypothetical protein
MMRLDAKTFAWIFVITCLVTSSFAAKNDDKKALYSKGMQAVNAGDAITARDSFCELAGRDRGYYDSAQQCQIYADASQRLMMRYKINYGEALTLLAQDRFEEASTKLRNVKGGDYAVLAQQRLAEIPNLKAMRSNSQESIFERMMHVGDSGTNFAALCDGNEDFEQRNRGDQHSTQSLFCGGWVRGASQAVRSQLVTATSHDVCIPQTVTVGQQTRILLRYIAKHQQEKELAANELLTRAMREAFPCRLLNRDQDENTMYESQLVSPNHR